MIVDLKCPAWNFFAILGELPKNKHTKHKFLYVFLICQEKMLHVTSKGGQKNPKQSKKKKKDTLKYDDI